jgi:hypothetical protein
MPLKLSAPRNLTFIVSVVLALVAVVVHFANVDLPITPTQGFLILLLGYLVLAAGNVARGL